MKLTVIMAAVASLFIASSIAHEQWVYNDHRRPIAPRAVPKIGMYSTLIASARYHHGSTNCYANPPQQMAMPMQQKTVLYAHAGADPAA